jgi:hypothetical protein
LYNREKPLVEAEARTCVYACSPSLVCTVMVISYLISIVKRSKSLKYSKVYLMADDGILSPASKYSKSGSRKMCMEGLGPIADQSFFW